VNTGPESWSMGIGRFAHLSGPGGEAGAISGKQPGDGGLCADRVGGNEADPGPPVQQVHFAKSTLVAEGEDQLGPGHPEPFRDRIRQRSIVAGQGEHGWRLGAVAGHQPPWRTHPGKLTPASGARQRQCARQARAGGAPCCGTRERCAAQGTVHGVLHHPPVGRELPADHGDDAVR
jgi:hypothetical protein